MKNALNLHLNNVSSWQNIIYGQDFINSKDIVVL